MWPPRRSTTHELELQREVTTLQLKLLRVNSALAIKTQYATRLEYLLHQRSERIDELNSKREQSRAQVQRLGLENEILTAMIAAPPVDAAMLAPKKRGIYEPAAYWTFACFDSAAVCAGRAAGHGQVEGGCTKGRKRHPWG